MANTYTPNLKLAKPAHGDIDWHIPVNGNWDILDTKIKAITDSIVSRVPPGVIMMYGSNTPPSGWLECNGAAISRTTYSALFSVIGTTYGSGNGTTTFNLPDLRGEFIRGWDHGRGVDPERVLGSSQEDEFKRHSHQIGAWSTSGPYPADELRTGEPGGRTTEVGGTETRPRNVALMFIIKT
jgi:phage-related tail fiber protein